MSTPADAGRVPAGEPLPDAGLLPVADARTTRAAVRVLLAAHRARAAFAAVCLLAAAACSLAAAPLLGRIVDLAADGDASGLTRPVLLLAGAAIGQGALAYAGMAAVARLGEEVLATTRETFVDRALDLPLERIERGGSGDLTSRVTEDIAMVSEAVRGAVPEFVQSALIIALTLAGLTALDWRFAVAALVALPIQALTARWYVQRSGPIYGARRRAAGGEQQQLLETVGGAATVRAFGLAGAHVDQVERRIDRSISATVALTRLHTRFFGRLNIAEAVGLSAVLVTGFLLVDDGAVTIGAASAAALYFANLFGPVNSALFLLDTLQSATASLARIVGVTDLPAPPRPPDPVTSAGADSPADLDAAPADGSLAVRDLRYTYLPGQEVLHGVSFDVPAGGSVALVGGSGGGKTTLAKLLAGVHAPSAGTIRVGGSGGTGTDPVTLRATVALVTQEVHVFAGTLAEDLRLAAPRASETELWNALAAAGAADWVGALPDGLDTVVGDGGLALDPARAQHLALARLQLADPAVAILDEATAEAGSSGARQLEAAAQRVLAGRTSVVVAHRLSQAADADLILVLDDGHVVERGSHEDLLAASGRYAQLWRTWSAHRC
ncbi:ABC transporter ATP-binding protein [Frankia sp. AvcI1]|uniref:ABC transporter ATP-binding protein n=1 Tax=Frankia sp. AvcI1 TaxID=573496 RepID=UPI00211971E3|nr:ABC transporter ATP-binding protein [Frankia sp. AvcI1]